MSTFSALYYHLVWSTKNREPIIPATLECQLYRYLAGIIQAKKGTPIQIGGMTDHVHLLLGAKPDINLSLLVKEMKVSSTLWMRQQLKVGSQFSWQEGFGVFSVSKSNADAVKKYIENQKQHHASCTFENEMRMLLDRHEVKYDSQFLLG